MNNFTAQLDRSEVISMDPKWEAAYRVVFPRFQSMNYHMGDGWHQRAGIDRTIVMTDSRIVRLDEKVREIDYGDILLEEYTIDKYGIKAEGWVSKSSLSDYIAYLILPSGKLYLLPVLQLQAVWEIFGEEIKHIGKMVEARNEWGTTVSWALKPEAIYEYINKVSRVKW